MGMIVQLGPKNKLQNLGFRTYYNQSALQGLPYVLERFPSL